MNKKNTVKKTAALVLALGLAIGGVGCTNFIVTDSAKDLAQTVATVDISASLKADKDSEYNAVAGDVEKMLGRLSTSITKRDLVAYFLSTGYQYVESYGYTYEDTFNMLMDGLVSREIMIQYAVAYYLKNNPEVTVAKCDEYVAAELASTSYTEKEKELLKANPSVLTLKFFLTDGGKAEKMEEYDRTVYQLKKSINDSLDSMEQSYIQSSSEEHDHAEARTLPTGANEEKEEYFEKGAYDIYTGRNNLDECGSYEKVDGSTKSTRQKAYNAFLSNLQGYNMINSTGKTEDTSNVKELNYYYVELSSSLGQSLINKYFKDLEESVTVGLDAEYVGNKYTEILNAQEKKYSQSHAEFETAMDSVSDSSFLLYGLKDFGYVYNILLPFDAIQNAEYTTAKNDKANKQEDLYNIRKNLLENVEGKDQRGSWISSHDHANYSYTVKNTEGTDDYYFFESQVKGESDKYQDLKQYAGTYKYNGTVTEDEDGELVAKANPVKIDEFMSIMKSHIQKTVNPESPESVVIESTKNADYGVGPYKKTDGEIDYSKFTYETGKVALTGTAKDYFNKSSDVYKAVSAVNELMFAYSTDTGCLNTYFGYAVSPHGTDFVKEFEYAAQDVVRRGVGSYAVCATDYGWHIVFASFVYDGGEVYGGYNVAEANVEGTFSNMFYESIKSSAAENYSTEVQNTVLNKYNNSDSVTLFTSRYQDLLDLDK